MKGLGEYVRENPGLESFIFEEADAMLLLTGEKGEVYVANRAFQNWIGYSNHEFTRAVNPVTWIKFTVPDENLEADIQQARLCVAGELKSYRVRKDYLPKNQHAKLVEVHVRRFPQEGPFRFFVVEAEPLYNGHERMARSYERFTKRLGNALEELAKTQENIAGTQEKLVYHIEKPDDEITLNSTIKWLRDNPKWGIPLALFFGFLLFGERVLEFINLFRST